MRLIISKYVKIAGENPEENQHMNADVASSGKTAATTKLLAPLLAAHEALPEHGEKKSSSAFSSPDTNVYLCVI